MTDDTPPVDQLFEDEAYPPIACPYCGESYTWDASLIKRVNICRACEKPFRVSGDGTAMEAGDYDLAVDPELAVAPAPATRTCEGCDKSIPAEANVCPACGFNHAVDGKRSTAFDRRTIVRAPPRLAMRDICRIPFRGDAMAEAVTVMTFTLGWSMVALLGLAAVLVASVMSPGLFIFAMVLYSGVLMLLPAFVAQRYDTIAQQYEQGSLIGQAETSRLLALGQFMWHSAVASLPVLFVVGVTAAVPGRQGDAAAVWCSALLALCYWFMAIAMAGVHGTLNPAAVIAQIFRHGRRYAFVLLYAVPLIVVAQALGVLVTAVVAAWFLSLARQGPDAAVAEFVATVLMAVIMIPFAQFGIFAGLAMVAALLRRDRLGSVGEPFEYRKAAVFPLATIAAAVFLGGIALAVTHWEGSAGSGAGGGGSAGSGGGAPRGGTPIVTAPPAGGSSAAAGAGATSGATAGSKPSAALPGQAGRTTAAPVGKPVSTLPAAVDLNRSSLLPVAFDVSQAAGGFTRSGVKPGLIDKGQGDVATRGVANLGDTLYGLMAWTDEVWVRYQMDYAAADKAFNLRSRGKGASPSVVLYTDSDVNILPHAVVLLRPSRSMWITVDRTTPADVRAIAIAEMKRDDQLFIYFLAPKGATLSRVHVGETQWAVRPEMTLP